MKLLRYSTLLLLALAANRALPQEAHWVNVSAEGEMSRYESQAAAENRLLSEARTLAIQKATGYTVRTLETLATRETTTMGAGGSRDAAWFESYLNYSRFESAGRIVAEDLPKFTTADKDGRRMLRVELRAKVAIESELADPGLSLNLRTAQPAYREGDTIRISAESTRAGRLYLFNMLGDGTCTLVWPNSIEADNRVEANKAMQIPRNKNLYAMVAELHAGSDGKASPQSDEMLFGLLYLGDEQVFNPSDAFKRKYSHADLNNAIIRIPRNMRYETMTSFSIAQNAR